MRALIAAAAEAMAEQRSVKQVIELYDSHEQPAQDQGRSCYCPECERLSKELAALKAQQQEPFCCHDGRDIVGKEFADHSDVFPLYTSPQPAIPQGWRLVPVEPTMNMIFAMRRTDTYGDAWTEALNAAPQPQGEQK